MLFLRLWNYVRGYVIIIVEGYFLEKFINICTHRQIFLWDLKRRKNSEMSMKVSIKGFRMLRPVAKKSGCRIRIESKRGLPFTFNKYRRRKAFAAGAACFAIILYILSSFVWAVEISGNEKIDANLVSEKLAELGVKPGVIKFGINTDKVVNDMMLGIEDLSWMSITVKGTKVKVHLAERRVPPLLVDKNEPCDIIAAKDGVISEMIVKDGQEAVKEGDTVKAGQLLISGRVKIRNEVEKVRLVRAIGSVKARTWYEQDCPVETELLEKERTGLYKDQLSLVLFNKRINLFHGEVKFDNYDKIELKKRLALGEDYVLPFEYVIDQYYENRYTKRELTQEEAGSLAADNALKILNGSIPEDAEKVKTSLSFVAGEGSELLARVTVECIEEIGITSKIGGN